MRLSLKTQLSLVFNSKGQVYCVALSLSHVHLTPHNTCNWFRLACSQIPYTGSVVAGQLLAQVLSYFSFPSSLLLIPYRNEDSKPYLLDRHSYQICVLTPQTTSSYTQHSQSGILFLRCICGTCSVFSYFE